MKLRYVPASTGIQWVQMGIRTFLRQPLALAGLFFMFMATVSVLAVIPILGTALSAVLTPAANLGLMAASREASQGRFPMPLILISAFRQGTATTRAILVLGGLYAGALLAVLLLGAALAPRLDGLDTAGGMTPELVQALLNSPGTWLTLLAYLPVLMAFWHAPALVVWHGVSPVKSLFFSLLACWQNKGALLFYALAWLGVFLLAGLLISVIGGAIGGAGLLQLILYPAVMLVASMFYASVYFSFEGSFDASEPNEPAAVRPAD